VSVNGLSKFPVGTLFVSSYGVVLSVFVHIPKQTLRDSTQPERRKYEAVCAQYRGGKCSIFCGFILLLSSILFTFVFFVYFLICDFLGLFAIAAGEEYSPVPGAQSGGKRGDKAGLLASAW
jgi:hypothetical protein